MLVPMKEIVDAAYAGGYAVPALPSWSELLIRAEMEAADATNSPVIFLSFNHPDAKEFHELIGRLAEKANVPSVVKKVKEKFDKDIELEVIVVGEK